MGAPPKTEQTFSTPRAWHMLSDTLESFGESIDDETLMMLASGTVSAEHAAAFKAYVRVLRHTYGLDAIIKGDAGWPTAAQDVDVLYFLAESLRARLIRELPADRAGGGAASKNFAFRAKTLLVELAEISTEVAQMVVAEGLDGNPVLPSWFMVEVTRDLPRLVAARN